MIMPVASVLVYAHKPQPLGTEWRNTNECRLDQEVMEVMEGLSSAKLTEQQPTRAVCVGWMGVQRRAIQLKCLCIMGDGDLEELGSVTLV